MSTSTPTTSLSISNSRASVPALPILNLPAIPVPMALPMPMPLTHSASEPCPPLPFPDAPSSPWDLPPAPRRASASCQDLLEDLDLRILMERFQLLRSQREMAALRCARFLTLLEEEANRSANRSARRSATRSSSAAAAAAEEEEDLIEGSPTCGPACTLYPMYSAEEREFVEGPRYTALPPRQRRSAGGPPHRARRPHRRQPSWPCAGPE